MQSGGSGLNIAECLRQGAVGAVGAIPGTTLAHPFDLLKIRMQTGASPSLLAAVRDAADVADREDARGRGACGGERQAGMASALLASEVCVNTRVKISLAEGAKCRTERAIEQSAFAREARVR